MRKTLYTRRDYEHSTPTNSIRNISVYGINKHKHTVRNFKANRNGTRNKIVGDYTHKRTTINSTLNLIVCVFIV